MIREMRSKEDRFMTDSNKKHYCYILRCNDGSLYSGYTVDLERRVWEHNNSDKGAKYTRGRRPCSLVYFEEFDNKNEAMQREAQLKKLKKSDKEKLIKEQGTE